MRHTQTLAAFALAAAVLAGCGGPGEGEKREAAAARQAEESAQAEAERSEEIEAQAEAEREEQQAAYDKCKNITAPLRSALSEMNSRLAVGLNYDDYTNRLGDVQVAYDKVVLQINPELGDGCINSAVKLENAVNEYNKVSNAWGDCFDDYNCDFERDKLQEARAGWERAGTALIRSERTLERMAP